jgi:DNA-binding Xre family transcriptional regulator
VIKKMSYAWHVRSLLAARGIFQTSEVVPLLAERGIHLSREQVYRLVTQIPQRLSLDILAALCDILECTPADLIEVRAAPVQVRKSASGSAPTPTASVPRRAVVRRPPDS